MILTVRANLHMSLHWIITSLDAGFLFRKTRLICNSFLREPLRLSTLQYDFHLRIWVNWLDSPCEQLLWLFHLRLKTWADRQAGVRWVVEEARNKKT